ncbi:hypothetical protein HNQ56_004405 [Anaerotaenia torta]|uniref:hypothetical protein n=1 Tax=Anaerotaenia torta TaxID=433293 RepID=UPI003D263934
MAVYRNHEYYIDRTAGEAIQRVCDNAHRKKQNRLWGDRLTYRIGEVMGVELSFLLHEE